MATCKTDKGLFLTEEFRNKIIDTHTDLQVPGLTPAEQEEFVSYISNKMYQEALVQGESFKLSDLQKYIYDTVSKTIKSNAKSIEALTTNETEAEDNKDIVGTLTTINGTLESALKHSDKLIQISKVHLNNIQGLRTVNTKLDFDIADLEQFVKPYKTEPAESSEYIDTTNIDLSQVYTQYGEVDAERTSFSDNFSLQLNSKNKIGGKLKSFLSFISKEKFTRSRRTRKLKTFFGTDAYMTFDTVYDEVHRLTEGIYPNFDKLIARLEERFEEAKDTRNDNLAWVGNLVEQLKAADETTKRMFVRDMAKHKVVMEHVYFQGYFNKEGKYVTRLTVRKDNDSTAGIRLHKAWKTAHTKSAILNSDGVYDKDKVARHYNILSDIKKSYNPESAKIAVQNLLIDLGIEAPDTFITALTDNKITIYAAGKQRYTSGVAVIDALMREILLMHGPVSTVLDSSFFKGFANSAAKFNPNEFSNVFRVGDNLIYTYTNNHFLYNRIRDLKESSAFREQLNNTTFSEHSLYLELLENDEDFADWYNMNYVSLATLLKKSSNGYRRSEGFTSLPDIDVEIVAIAYAFRNNKKEIKNINGEDFTVSKGTTVIPTVSDKSRALTINGYTFHVTDYSKNIANANEKGKSRINPYSYEEKAINLYYKSIVQAEISRIQESSNQDFLQSLDLSTYNGDIFYMAPYLNELYLDPNGNKVDAESGKLFTDIIIDGDDFSNADQTIKAEIEKDLIRKAEDRASEWVKLGLVDGVNLKHLSDSRSYTSSLGNISIRAMEAALDITFSEEINRANVFQLIVGDPAQFFKKDLQGTYSNITKRLASLVAPGEESDYSAEPNYIQVFLNDKISVSKTIDTIMQELDGVKYSTFQSWQSKIKNWYENSPNEPVPEDILKLENKVQNLKSLAYTAIEGTDAQEYVTWKTHLKEMLRYSELTDEEYNEYYAIINSGKELKGKALKKVLGPRKPVYANTELQKLGGSNRNFYRHTYIKSSTFPLLPQLVKGHQLEKLASALDTLEKEEGLGVRAAYKTAAKVGFPKTGVDVFDENGEVYEDLDLKSSMRVLSYSGLRIQQSIPFKEDKSETVRGSQEAKLLFTGILDNRFKFNGSTISGKELQDIYNGIYRELSKIGYEALQDYILNEDGSLNNQKLSKLLLQELDKKEEVSKPLRDGLQIDPNTGDFVLPLWESAYIDDYMSLVNSIVDKAILKKEMPGGSAVLGSEEGFISWEYGGKDLAEQNKGIIYTDKYDPSVGLLGQRVDEKTGKILPAQVLLPTKFRDSKGKLIDIGKLTKKGTNLIDIDKLPDELRESFTFRIPTQLQQSMSYVEIVGFLPKVMGDLVIAPKDFVVQMGSDFDVDKLYYYIYNTEFKDNKLSKIPYTEDSSSGNYKAGLQNKIIDIHKTILLSADTQSRIKTPLDLHAKGFKNVGDKVEIARGKSNDFIDSLISHKYNRKKLNDGAAGNDGIAIFSSDSILNSLSQNKDMLLTEFIMTPEGKIQRAPIYISFGKLYGESIGKIGLNKSLKKDSTKSPADLISATQTLSVDNAVLEVMSKINMNTDTAGVYTLLHMLGFEEDITAHFMSQPIIFDYIQKLRNNKGMFSVYDPAALETIDKELSSKYDPLNTYQANDIELADFGTYKDASIPMLEMIEKGEEYGEDYGKTQIAILNKFKKLKIHAESLLSLRQFLNVDSKGFDKNIYKSVKKLKGIEKIDKHSVFNAKNLFDNTLAAADINYGLRFLVDNFSNLFIETDTKFEFDAIVASIERSIDRNLSDQELYDVRNNIVHSMHTKLKDRNADSLRELLFRDTSENSFYTKVLKLKNSIYGQSNKFLQNIDIDNVDGTVIINNTMTAGDDFNDTAIYISFIDMLTNNSVLDNGLNPSEVAQQLVYYILLKGGRKGVSLKKYIPAYVLNLVLEPTAEFDYEIFTQQYLQNNSSILNEYSNKDITELENGSYIIKNDSILPIAITINKGSKLLLRTPEGLYTEVIMYTNPDLSVYSDIPIVRSIKETNTFDNIEEDTGNVVTALLNGEISSIADLYNIADDSELSVDMRLLLSSLKALNSNIEVEFRPLDNGVDAEYSKGKISINSDSINLGIFSDNRIITAAIHEHLHSLTYSPISTYFSRGDSGTKVDTSIQRLDTFMTEHIEGIMDNVEVKTDFTNFLKLTYSTLNIDTLRAILPTVHNIEIQGIIQESISNLKSGTPLNPKDIEMLQASYRKITEEGNFKYYYALSSIYEFIAVTPTELKDLESKLNTKEYKSIIAEFFANILEALGIKGNLKGLLNDVYTIANVVPKSNIPTPYIEKSFLYRDETASYNKDLDAFVCCASTDRILSVRGDELFADYTNSLYNTYKDETNLNWIKKKKVKSIIKDIQQFTGAENNLDPVTGVFVLSKMEQKSNKYSKEIDILKKSLGIAHKPIKSRNLTNEEIVKLSQTKPKPKVVYSENKELNKYLANMAQYATGIRGSNSISNSLRKSEDIGKASDEVEFKSLKSLGRDLIEKCGGVVKSGKKWSIVNGRSMYNAKRGLSIPKEKMLKNISNKWSLTNIKSSKNYEYGAVALGDKHNWGRANSKKSKNWDVVTKLDGPSHAQGGIDLSVSNGKVFLKRGDTTIKAEYGLFINASIDKKTKITKTKAVKIKPKIKLKRIKKRKRYIKRKNRKL